MDELEILLNRYDDILRCKEIPLLQTKSVLYRGDKYDLSELEEKGGCIPKNNAKEPLDFYNIIQHCIENGYGGPFISVTAEEKRAKEFANGFLYVIRKGINIVNFSELISILKSSLEEIGLAIKKLKEDNSDIIKNQLFINQKNLYEKYKSNLDTAEKYHIAQSEELVPYKIDLEDIEKVIELN